MAEGNGVCGCEEGSKLAVQSAGVAANGGDKNGCKWKKKVTGVVVV